MRAIAWSLLVACAPLLAAPPANDDWAGRLVIAPASLSAPGGYTDSQPTIGEATTVTSDPLLVCKNGDPAQRGNTVWYSLTLPGGAGDSYYVNLSALGYDSIVSIYTGSPGAFRPVVGACNDDGAAGFAAQLSGARLVGGSEYSILVARPSQNTNAATLSFTARNAPLYTVTKTADTLDGACNADCSLREAIAASNATPGAVIVPAGSYALTRSGSDDNNTNGDLDLTSGMGVYGAGRADTQVSGLSGERLFDLDPANSRGHTFQIRGLALQGGSPFSFGGAIKSTTPTSPGNDHLALVQSELFENSTSLAGGGLRADGPTVVFESHIRSNAAGSDGGGLSFGGDANTRVDIAYSTINSNQSNGTSAGGGGGVHSSSNTVIYNSTIAGNSARNNGGGVLSTLASGRITLLNVTLAGNQSDQDGNAQGFGGGIRMEGNFAAIQNSALFLNTGPGNAGECSKAAGLTNVTLSFNHVEGPGGDCGFASGTNNVVGQPVGPFEPFGDYGGGTPTIPPAAGSELIDSGSNALCLSDDQRGFARPQDGDGDGTATCDKGAVEFVGDRMFADGFEDPPTR
jgi:CSLREA domain-containing protein